MAFIPQDARWYLADIVLEHRIVGDRRNVVHVNKHLIEADSPQQARRKANALGKRGQRLLLCDAPNRRILRAQLPSGE